MIQNRSKLKIQERYCALPDYVVKLKILQVRYCALPDYVVKC